MNKVKFNMARAVIFGILFGILFNTTFDIPLGIFADDHRSYLRAQTLSSFQDIPVSHPQFQAIEYLKKEGIISGYKDGNYRPQQKVNRAEALKIVLNAKKIAIKEITTSSFKDVLSGDWYLPYVETAKALKIIQGNADGTFAPSREISQIEFLKMLLVTFEVKFINYKSPSTSLYPDTTNNSEWYTPYLDFAKNVNLITRNSTGNIEPQKNLSRAEIAEITYRLLRIMKGEPHQLLLSRAEASLAQAAFDLEKNNLIPAEENIKKAKNLANQAALKKPNDQGVKAILKLIESFEKLLEGSKQISSKEYEIAVKNLGLAHNLADETLKIAALSTATDLIAAPNMNAFSTLSSLVKNLSANLANRARAN